MKTHTKIGLGLIVFALITTSLLAFLFSDRPRIEALLPTPDNAQTVTAETGLSVRFLGTATLLFDDGETQIMTDGFFSRPGLLKLLGNELTTDDQRLQNAIANLKLERLAAIVPVHSHHDHAMDSAELVRLTGAQLIGSSSTANLGYSIGLNERQISVAQDRATYQLGRFSLQLIPSKHVPMPGMLKEKIGMNQAIGKLDHRPSALVDYKEGTSYSVLISHPQGRFLVQGSAGYVPGKLAGIEADVVFLGIAGLSKQGDDYINDYWKETVDQTKASQVIAIHWDDFTRPVQPEAISLPRFIDNLDRTIAKLKQLAGKQKRGPKLLRLEPYRVYSVRQGVVYEN